MIHTPSWGNFVGLFQWSKQGDHKQRKIVAFEKISSRSVLRRKARRLHSPRCVISFIFYVACFLYIYSSRVYSTIPIHGSNTVLLFWDVSVVNIHRHSYSCLLYIYKYSRHICTLLPLGTLITPQPDPTRT